METIRVNLDARSYDIIIQTGALARAGEWLARFPIASRTLVIMDENTAELFGALVLESMKAAGFDPVSAVITPGETSKSLSVADRLYENAIRAGLDRNCAIVALGGGVVGDLGGFVAATYQRGVPFLQIPTTLLSQVDSSVGGKVAVNHALGKNLIGAFYQPRGVLIDPETLISLPEREFASGMAEVIKYGLIFDEELLAELTIESRAIRGRTLNRMERVIARCCHLKAEVVERDEQDVGDRMLLNFGHTAGHAIEAAGGFKRYTHGEGVALGMLVATRLSELTGSIPQGCVDAVRSLLQDYGLPIHVQNCNETELLGYMNTDKKREAGKLRWIVLDRSGQAVVRSNISEQSIRESLQVIL
ncbi:MAG: 3-dehydroquinate synthase [Negativicutes bacterium]